MATLFRRKAGGNWHVDYVDASGNRFKKSLGTRNRRAAETIMRQMMADDNFARHGVTDSGLSLQDLFEEYLTSLGNSGEKHVSHVRSRVGRFFDVAEWESAKQITQHEVERIARELVDLRTKRKLALRTQSHYLGAIKSFTRWLTHVRKVLQRDPLAAVRKPNFEADRKLERRLLLPDEWTWLSLTPNATLYATAIQTGFRANEIMHVGRSNLQDDHIFLPARHTKNKKDAIQYITPELHDELVSALPFSVPNDGEYRLAELLRADLASARENWESQQEGDEPDAFFLRPRNARGQVLDFHALRHTCGAWLAIEGVNPKTIQAVMRHSSIVLTLDTYGHLLPGAEKNAIEKFRSIMAPKAQSEEH